MSRDRKKFFTGLVIGMAPDLLSELSTSCIRDGSIRRLAGNISGPPDLALVPAYVFHAYSVTHSLVVCAGVFISLWLLTKNAPWLLSAWLLHSLRYPDTRGGLLPNAFSMTVSDTVR